MAKQRILNPNMFIPRIPNTYQASRGYAMPAEGAVVYGDMPALQALPQGIQNVANARLANQQQQQAEAQRVAQMWRDNELEAADGQLWSNQLGSIEQKHIQEGQQLMQEGINPYESMDPRAVKYRRERRNIEGLRAYRGATEKSYVGLMQEMRKNPDKYDPESVQALQDWISQGNVEDYYRSGAQLPGLQARFDVNDALKGFTAPTSVQTRTENNRKITDTSIDRSAAERAIIGRIMSSPGGMRQLERITGGLPVQDVLSAPETLEENVAMYNALYEGDPQFRTALASQGINSQDDPRYRQVVENAAQRRVQAKQALNQQMDNWVSMSSSGLKLGRSETPDFTEANYRERVLSRQLSERREARLAAGETPQQASEEPVDLMIPYGPYNPEGNQPQVQARNYIPMSIPNRNFVGSEAIDLYTGRPTQIGESSADYSIVGVTQVPVSKNPITGGVPKGSLVQPGFASANPNSVEWKEVVHVTKGDGEDYFVDINRLPKNLTKDQKALVDRFKQAAGSSNTSGSQLSAEELIRKYSQ